MKKNCCFIHFEIFLIECDSDAPSYRSWPVVLPTVDDAKFPNPFPLTLFAKSA